MLWLKRGVRLAIGVAVLGVGIGIFSVLVATKPKAPRAEQADRSFAVRSMTTELVSAPRVWEGFGTARPKSSSDISAEVAGIVTSRPEAIDPGLWVDAGDLIVQLDDTEYLAVLSRTEEVVTALEADLRGLDVESESVSTSLALAEESVTLTQSRLDRLRSAIGAGGASQFETEDLEQRLTQVRREAETLRERLNLIPTRKARLRSQLESEKANARVARLNVERCHIAAPIAGILQSVEVDEGERVGIGQAIARVVDLRVIEVPLKLPVSAATHLRIDDRAELTNAGSVDTSWEGAIVRIAPEADPATRTVTVYAELKQPSTDAVGHAARIEGMLLPGQFVSCRVYGSDLEERILVPRAAVQRDRVMVVNDDGRAEPRIVDVAYYFEGPFPNLHPIEREWAVITSGLGAGERVIISNLDELDPGTPVRPMDVRGLLAGSEAGAAS